LATHYGRQFALATGTGDLADLFRWVEDFLVQELDGADGLVVEGARNVLLIYPAQQITPYLVTRGGARIPPEVPVEAQQLVAVGLARAGAVPTQLHLFFDRGDKGLFLGGQLVQLS